MDPRPATAPVMFDGPPPEEECSGWLSDDHDDDTCALAIRFYGQFPTYAELCALLHLRLTPAGESVSLDPRTADIDRCLGLLEEAEDPSAAGLPAALSFSLLPVDVLSATYVTRVGRARVCFSSPRAAADCRRALDGLGYPFFLGRGQDATTTSEASVFRLAPDAAPTAIRAFFDIEPAAAGANASTTPPNTAISQVRATVDTLHGDASPSPFSSAASRVSATVTATTGGQTLLPPSQDETHSFALSPPPPRRLTGRAPRGWRPRREDDPVAGLALSMRALALELPEAARRKLTAGMDTGAERGDGTEDGALPCSESLLRALSGGPSTAGPRGIDGLALEGGLTLFRPSVVTSPGSGPGPEPGIDSPMSPAAPPPPTILISQAD
ncbi:hypothetical protein H696_00382 [Fonticula alba]|uniref:Uncharacterized protein n=1 Tax=Fonticula alba TaxID=691883 RepID=A0A058ZEK6_FONAL|nr:hypothetical protein H696_00382 [Fonticula alba]KCV72804.1 hypothetical protein H696_00382 [Fonticula alba]|eukprot:XP_009492505.1 hypothetical protein H696_00382 [Fonticula alba]